MLRILPGALPPNSTQHMAKTFLPYAMCIREEELILSYGNSVLTPWCGSDSHSWLWAAPSRMGAHPRAPTPHKGAGRRVWLCFR